LYAKAFQLRRNAIERRTHQMPKVSPRARQLLLGATLPIAITSIASAGGGISPNAPAGSKPALPGLPHVTCGQLIWDRVKLPDYIGKPSSQDYQYAQAINDKSRALASLFMPGVGEAGQDILITRTEQVCAMNQPSWNDMDVAVLMSSVARTFGFTGHIGNVQ
jgi:hypothetical protein